MIRESKNKTISVARRDHEWDKKREIKYRPSWGWLLPPQDDGLTGEGYIGGNHAYKECIRQWQEKGWTVRREPNPCYRPPDPLRGLLKIF